MLAEELSQDFSSVVRNRGASYFRSRRVRITDQERGRIQALVSGSGGDYDVEISLDDRDDELHVDCTCPHFDDGNLCKHIWATILEIDSRGLEDAIVGHRAEVATLAMHSHYYDDYEDDWVDDWAADPQVRSTRANNGHLARPRTPTWQQQLQSVRHHAVQQNLLSSPQKLIATQKLIASQREVWYVLDVSASLSRGLLCFSLRQRETKQNGEFGKPKVLSLDSRELERFSGTEDYPRLSLLDAASERQHPGYMSYYGYGHLKRREFEITPTSYELLLPLLCASPRTVWMLDPDQNLLEDSHCFHWDDGPPWRFRLHVEADDKNKQWIVTGQLTRPADGHGPDEAPLPLSAPVLLLAHGLVLLEDRLARFDRGDFAWVSLLRRDGEVRVPYDARGDLLRHIWELPRVPDMEVPVNLQVEQLQVQPQGRLRVNASKADHRKELPAEVDFLYDTHPVALDEGDEAMIDAAGERVILRDREAEEKLLAQLQGAGVRATRSRHDSLAKLTVNEQQLPQLVKMLIQQDWIVEAQGRRVQQAGQIRINVTSGVDWFELEGECDFGDQSVHLPALLAALRRGEKYVELGDGTRGLLPEEWLARYGSLAELGEEDGQVFKFHPSQTLLLDALLAAQDHVSVDRQFTKMCEKLRSFSGIKPRNAPRGFHGQLRNYQEDGLSWLHFLREFQLGGCLADDMGLGKTVQVLALLEQRRTRRKEADGRRTPSLAVMPRSLVFNWMDEAQRFTPRLRVANYTGAGRAVLLKDADQYDLLLTTYGTLRRDIVQLKEQSFDYVILDESQAIKNANSQSAKACRLLRCRHRLAMTGTPVENHLSELWSLLEFLNPGMLGRASAFQNVSREAIGDPAAMQQLSRALAPFILRRTKQQVLSELPEKVEQTLYCDLRGRQRKHYDELRKYYRASLKQKLKDKGLARSKIHVLEALLRLRQAACHPGLIDKKHSGDSSAKFDVLLDQLTEVAEEDHKALVFSQFTTLLSLLRDQLDQRGLTYEYLDGRTRKRKEKVQRFQQDDQCPLFLISLKAGGHGLNLTAADYVFILDPWWNPAVEAQAVDRAHRIGQTRSVNAYRLIARDTVEERILELQQSKRELADAIISSNSSVIRNLTADDLQLLLS